MAVRMMQGDRLVTTPPRAQGESLSTGDQDEPISGAEFAALFGHGPRWGTEMFRTGAIASFQPNGKGRRYTTRAAIRAWIAEQITEGRTEP